MNELKIFEDSRFGKIQAFERGGEPWFVAADVCRALDIGNVSQALTRLDEDEVTLILNEGGRELNIVSEPGLYTLILGSRKPEARAFKRWITHEVLPTLRQTGTYSLPHTMEQRGLTVDDYLRAAHITANCRNERLPYVLGFLEQAGFSIPEVKQTYGLPKPDTWEKAYKYLCDWVSANVEHFGDDAGPQRVGRMIGDFAVIPRPVFNQICEDAGFTHKAVLKAMRDYGILRTSGKGFTVSARIGKQDSVGCVWMKIFSDSDGEAG